MTPLRPSRLVKAGLAGLSALSCTPVLAQSVSATILGPLGVLLGVAAGIVLVLTLSRSAPVAKGLFALAAGALGAVTGFVVGAWLGYGIDFLRYEASPSGRSDRHQGAYQPLPLRAAACAADERAVASTLGRPLDEDGRRYLGAIAWNCRSQGGSNPATRLRIFTMLMTPLHSLYDAGQRLNDRRDGYDPTGRYTFDYCHVLDRLAGELDIERLNALRLAGLPLSCAGGNSVPTLDDLFLRLKDRALPRATVAAMAALIGGRAGLLAQSLSRDGENFLDRAVTQYDAQVVEIALTTGADALRPSPKGRRPVLVWAQRRLGQCPNCEYPTQAPLGTEADVAAVERLMPIPGPLELDAFDDAKIQPPFLSGITQLRRAPDGGAAMLRYAAEHGADLGIAFRGHGAEGGSFLAFHRAEDMKPALLDAIEQLGDGPFSRLAHPTYPIDGKPATPLLESARRSRNAPLIALLCRRGIPECSEAEKAGATRAPPRS